MVGIGCPFSHKPVLAFMKAHMFGLFDYGLGFCYLQKTRTCYAQYDQLVSDKAAVKLMPLVNKTHRLSQCASLMAIGGGYQSEESYLDSTDVTPRLHMIKKPFFFLSA